MQKSLVNLHANRQQNPKLILLFTKGITSSAVFVMTTAPAFWLASLKLVRLCHILLMMPNVFLYKADYFIRELRFLISCRAFMRMAGLVLKRRHICFFLVNFRQRHNWSNLMRFLFPAVNFLTILRKI